MTDAMKPTTVKPHRVIGHAAAPRVFAIDSAKGVGILLVVFGHAWRGLMSADIIPDGALFRAVDSAVYAFHMPLFFFLSGLVFLDTARKHAGVPLFRGRVTRLLWPMALWSWLFFGLKLMAGADANTPVTLAEFPIVPLPPYEHLWFLWALFLCQTLLILTFLFCRAQRSDRNIRIGVGVIGGALALINPVLTVPSLIWGPAVEHFPYFLVGIAFGGMASWQTARWVGILAGVGFTAMTALLGPEKASVLWSLVLVVMGWVVWQRVDPSVPSTGPVLKLLRYFGQVSMVIYLTHTAFSAALRIALIKFEIIAPISLLVLTVLVGVVGPLVVLLIAQKLRLNRMLGF